MTVCRFSDHVAQVEASVAAKPTVAFFDLDRTLIAGYSILAMARERARHGLTRGELSGSAAIMRDLLQEQRSLERGAGPSYHRLVKRLSRSLKGISEETLARLGQQAYDNSIARTLYRAAFELALGGVAADAEASKAWLDRAREAE